MYAESDQLARLGMESVKQNRLFWALDKRTRDIMEILIRSQAQNSAELDKQLKEQRSDLHAALRWCRQSFIQEDGEKRRFRVYFSLLEGLRFAKMQHRYEGIAQAHARTFEWIFRGSGAHQKPRHSFTRWLSAGAGTYWIQGKPASGKSTLMKFLLHSVHRLCGGPTSITPIPTSVSG